MNFREKRWAALAVVCLGQLMMILDATIVTVALPAIKHDLHFSQSSLTWIPNAYLISFGSLLLLGGRLGDLVGRRRMFLTGIGVFTVASLACGLAGSEATLIAARFVQGIGAALAASAILALIVVEFPEHGERVRAMSAYTFVSVAGGSLGLLVGGLLTQALDWHWIFWVNIPLGAVAYLAGRATLERDVPAERRGGVDVAGSVLVTLATMVAIFAIVGTEEHGFGSTRTLGLLAGALALFGAFAAVERRATDPILPVQILRVRSLMIGCVVRAFQTCGIWATFFLGAQFLEQVLHQGPIAAGAAFLPQTLVVAVLSLGVTPRLIARYGARGPLVFGLTVLVAGLGMFAALLEPGADYFPWLFVAFLVIGVGAGTSFMSLMTLSLRDVPIADAGVASGLLNVSQQIAAAFGLAVVGTLAAHQAGTLAERGETAVQALSGGYQLAYIVAAGGVALGLLVAAVTLRGPRRAQEAPISVAASDA